MPDAMRFRKASVVLSPDTSRIVLYAMANPRNHFAVPTDLELGRFQRRNPANTLKPANPSERRATIPSEVERLKTASRGFSTSNPKMKSANHPPTPEGADLSAAGSETEVEPDWMGAEGPEGEGAGVTDTAPHDTPGVERTGRGDAGGPEGRGDET